MPKFIFLIILLWGINSSADTMLVGYTYNEDCFADEAPLHDGDRYKAFRGLELSR